MSEQPDPLDPASWPTEPPKEAGWYFVQWHPAVPPMPSQITLNDCDMPGFTDDDGEWQPPRDGLRFYPVKLTPQALRAQHGSGGMEEEVAVEIEKVASICRRWEVVRGNGKPFIPLAPESAEKMAAFLEGLAAKIRGRGRGPGAGGRIQA